MRCVAFGLALLASLGAALAQPACAEEKPTLDALIAVHAKSNNVPESLVRRVILSESRYNPRAVGRGGTMGLMQIKHATARALGYAGSASGLLEPDTNLTYAVRYLAGAYRAAHGNADRAVAYFRSGYYRPKQKTTVGSARPAETKPVASGHAAEPKPARQDADASATRPTAGEAPR